jgi:thiamine biosynthesis lipoprotein
MTKFLKIVIPVFLAISCQNNPYTRIVGLAEGTTYSIIYSSSHNYQQEIEALLAQFEASLSIYNPHSIISKVNDNEDVMLDSFFIECYRLSKYVNEQTDGAFDISASPLFEIWGFGNKKSGTPPSQAQIDSVIKFCGMHNVQLIDGKIVKSDPCLQLNCNAIAKGYSVDVVAQFFDNHNVANYMVEIGGEVRCKGVNAKGNTWTIGIDKPEYGNYDSGANLQTIIALSGKSIATSGNYRRFFETDGIKYPHTINPHTGHAVHSNLLSVSVVANSCALADAYATALMVMGTDSAKQFLALHSELEGYLIFADTADNLQVYSTQGFAEMQQSGK